MNWHCRTQPEGDQVQEALSYHDGCGSLGVEDQKARSFRSHKDQCWVCWHCCSPVSKSPDFYFPVVSHLCRGCSAHGSLEALVTFPKLAVCSPHRAAFHPLECSLQVLPAGIAGTGLEYGLCFLPCSKTKEMEPFGS